MKRSGLSFLTHGTTAIQQSSFLLELLLLMGFLYYNTFCAFSPFFPKPVFPLVCLSHTSFLLPLSWQNILEVPLFLSNPPPQPSALLPSALRRPIPLVMLSQCCWAWFCSLFTIPLLSSGLSHSVNSVTMSTVHRVTELCWEAEHCGTMARAARTAQTLPAMQYWARKDIGKQQEHCFSARSASLKSGSSLMTFGDF